MKPISVLLLIALTTCPRASLTCAKSPSPKINREIAGCCAEILVPRRNQFPPALTVEQPRKGGEDAKGEDSWLDGHSPKTK